MKIFTFNGKNSLAGLFLLMFMLPLASFCQDVYDANFQSLYFGGPTVTISNKVGDGKTTGNIVVYRNVVTIDGQAIDAVIRTVSLSAGSAITSFDKTGTGTGYTNNNNIWFSPQFSFPDGGGSAIFNFQFIEGNSYVSASNTGTPVILTNVRINSYDIDGNGNNGSNQFNEFGGFFTSELAANTFVTTSYNSTTGLTKFISSTASNVTDAADSRTRLRVTYSQLSNFTIQVGAGDEGEAFFFLDFGTGPNWPTTPNVITAPDLDLNTLISGKNNSGTFCANPVSFTGGLLNVLSLPLTPSGGTKLERVKVSIPVSQISDGSSEQLLITGATSGSSIALNFANGAAISNVVLTGTTYSVTASVSGGESALLFNKSGSSTMTLSEAEKLMDALAYKNIKAIPTAGDRIFTVKLKDGAYESLGSLFTISVYLPPSITLQPQNVSLEEGANTILYVTSNATSFQWQVDVASTGVYVNVLNIPPYSGATTKQLTITNAPAAINNYRYRIIASNGGGCSLISGISSLAITGVLPVTWLNLSAVPQKNSVLLNWSTATEQNTKYFEVQHSTDGINFTTTGSKQATGNSSAVKAYQYIHTNVGNGKHYYRILQTDRDGKSTASKVISALIEGDDAGFVILSNPVTNGVLSIQVTGHENLSIYNMEGKRLFRKVLESGIHQIDVSGYSKGIYYLISDTIRKKIIVN